VAEPEPAAGQFADQLSVGGRSAQATLRSTAYWSPCGFAVAGSTRLFRAAMGACAVGWWVGASSMDPATANFSSTSERSSRLRTAS